MSSGLPRISVLVAVRNESRHIAATLQTLVDQDCPSEWLEVLVLDGESTDETVVIARSFQDRMAGLRIVPNPRVLSAAAWNIGLAEAKAPVVLILSGHVALPPDFIRFMLSQLTADVAGVGGRAVPVGIDARSELIALAFTSPLGNGGASFMQDGEPRAVETIAFGCYWRDRLLAVGGFDERIVRGQDWDLNLRLRAAGLVLWCAPKMVVRYSTRSDYSALWRRQYLAGLWKPYIHRKNRKPFLLRHWIPGLFVALLALSSMAGLWWPPAWLITASMLGLHMAASFWQTQRLGIPWGEAHSFWIAMWIIHTSYGIGFCFGLLKSPHRPKETA